MKTRLGVIPVLAFAVLSPLAFVTPDQAKVEVPQYNPATGTVFKGAVEEVRDRECAVSGGTGSPVVLLSDGATIEVRPASAELARTYEVSPSFSACGKAPDHRSPRRQPGRNRGRNKEPKNAPASDARRHDVLAVAVPRLLVSPPHPEAH
jgi:hypothetical protein